MNQRGYNGVGFSGGTDPRQYNQNVYENGINSQYNNNKAQALK